MVSMSVRDPSTLLVDDLEQLRKRAREPWGVKVAEAILDEARTFGELDGDDLLDWPSADLVGKWAWDSRSDELDRIGHNRNAFIVAMGSVRRSQRIRRELIPLATAAAIFPREEQIREDALRYFRAPLKFGRWQYPGYTLYYKEHTMPADGDGEWGATENYLVTLPICAELLSEWLTAEDLVLLRRRVGEFCSRIEDDFYSGRSWFFGGLDGGTPAGNQFTQIIGGLAVGALSLLGHDPRAERWVSVSADQLVRSMDATGQDGSYFEGAAYGLGTMEQVWMAAHLLERKGDTRLIQHPQVTNFPYWLMDTFLPDYDHWMPFNDSGGSLRQESLYNRRRNWAGRVFAMSAARNRDKNLAWCLEKIVGGPSRDVFGLLCYDPTLPSIAPTGVAGTIGLKPSGQWRRVEESVGTEIPFGIESSAAGGDRRIVHYPEQGIVIARTGFDPDSILVALKGGWSCRGHDHNDRNSIIVYDGPVPIITETGPGPYSDPEFDLHFGSHHAHSTVQVDGEIFPHGSAAVGIEGVEVVVDDSGDTINIIGEASGSYPSLAVFERRVAIRFPDIIDISDRIVSADGSKHEIAFWFHTHERASITAEGDALIIPGNAGNSWRLSINGESVVFREERLGGDGSEGRKSFVTSLLMSEGEVSLSFKLERID